MMMSAQSCCSICTLTDWDGKDLIIGGKGDDTFQGYDDSNPAPENDQDATGYQGNDWIDGGSGNDTMGYSSNSGDQAGRIRRG